MTTPTAQTERILLKGASDWNSWYGELTLRAAALQLSRYIDLGDPTDLEDALVKPTMPDITTDFGAASIASANDHQMNRYNAAFNVYRIQNEEFNRVTGNLAVLKEWMLDTIASNLKPLFIHETHIKPMLSILEENCRPIPSQDFLRLEQDWKQLTKKCSSYERDFDTWLSSISRTYAEAAAIRAPFASDAYGIATSFLDGAHHFYPEWANKERFDLCRKDDPSDVPSFAQYVRRIEHWRLILTSITCKRKAALAGFDVPTFQDKHAKGDKTSLKHSRPRHGSTKKHCPCGSPYRHSLDDCWALHEARRPANWRGKRQIEALEKARKNDPQIERACLESLARTGGQKGKVRLAPMDIA